MLVHTRTQPFEVILSTSSVINTIQIHNYFSSINEVLGIKWEICNNYSPATDECVYCASQSVFQMI
jgi:hypothetical protein